MRVPESPRAAPAPVGSSRVVVAPDVTMRVAPEPNHPNAHNSHYRPLEALTV
jgi:hypothetical protein